MNVQAQDISFAQQALLAQVGTAVLAMSIRDARNMADRFQILMETADRTINVISDVSVGHQVDLVG